MQTIADLFWGRLSPWSQKEFKSEEIHKFCRLAENSSKQIAELLDEEHQSLLMQYEAANGEVENMKCEDAFIKGFSLGVRMMIEALDEKDT